MTAARPLRIAFVGSGNVATHLARRFHELGHRIVAVAARSEASAHRLACQTGAKAYDNVKEIPADVDLVVISTSDSSVADVSAALPKINGIVAHTSGSVPIEALSCHHCRAAVLYPLQTFSAEVAVDVSDVPFFVEASDAATLDEIKAIATELSDKVYEADSNIRAKLHVAGVLSSNFVIFLLEMTRRVLLETGLSLDVVRPLVEASVTKAFSSTPMEALTGPARRGDIDVVRKQSATFSEPLQKEIYDALSEAILKEFNHISLK